MKLVLSMLLCSKAVSKLRPPRPDDPTPRLPPVWFNLTRIGLSNSTKRSASGATSIEARPAKKTKTDTEADGPVIPLDASVKELGKKSRIGTKPPATKESGTFKVPNLPQQKRTSEKPKEKGKAKEKTIVSDADPKADGQGGDIESNNKMVPISSLRCLSLI